MSLGVGVYAPAKITFLDSMRKKGSLECYGVVLTAGNFDAKRALFAHVTTGLVAKTLALTNGVEVANEYGIETTFLENLPGDTLAARQNKFLVRYKDNTTAQKLTLTIPTADLSAVTFLTGAGDNIALNTPAAVTEWITAFQNFAVNPNTGNPVTVYGMEFVGRPR